MKKHSLITLLLSVTGILLLCAAAVWAIVYYSERMVGASSTHLPPTLVIDAGHGGFDGGAISEDGTRESDINLSIALRLDSIVRFCGQKTVMTRWDDSRKTDILSYSERDDLRQRAELTNSTDNAVLISIHQNYYPTAQPKGAQVLYSSFGNSEKLGSRMQELLVSRLDPENRRLAAPAPSDLYLTSNVRCPAVLVECGFMSNPSDLATLRTPEGRDAIAQAVADAFTNYKKKYDGVAARKEEAAATGTADAPATTPAPAPETVRKDGVLYGTQVLATGKTMSPKDPFFAGYVPVEIKGTRLNKYVIGHSTDEAEARRLNRDIRKKFEDSFLVRIEGDSVTRIQ